MTEALLQLTCAELAAFDAASLAAVRAAFAQADSCLMQQGWRKEPEEGFTPAVVRVGRRGNSLLVFVELEDVDIFTRATKMNQRMWELGDTLEIFLSPEESPDYVEFHVTPNNHRLQLRFPSTEALRAAQAAGSLDKFLLAGRVFHSHTWVEDGRWCVYAEIPAVPVCGANQLLPGTRWRFSFSRYDFSRESKEPVISSTSPHAKPDFHRREEWGILNFV